jgi:hypothetical protein
MGNMRTFVLIVSLAFSVMAQTPKTKSPPMVRPSLDLLVSRIDGYWRLLQLRKKLQAAQYIVPSDRNYFSDIDIPSFSDPRLKSLELSPDRTEATATVIVKRMLFPITQTMEWPVTEKWHFEKGNWYRSFSKTALPFQGSLSGRSRIRDPQQDENVRQEIRDILQIETPILDFGTVRESAPVQLSLKYTLKGSEPLAVEYKPTGPGFIIQGLEGRQLLPGQNRELLIDVSTWYFQGDVNERLILTAQRQGVEVPIEIVVKGKVYVPVSVTPKVLYFEKNESEKEIQISNNSKTDIELLQVFSETGLMTVQPLPTRIPAGQKLALKVSLTKKVSEIRPNTRDSISINLAQRVDDVGDVSVMVVLNSTKPKPDGPFNPADNINIQEIIRQNRIELPSRSK